MADLDKLVEELERSYRGDARADVRSGRLQRPPRGGGGRAAAEGARGTVEARRGVEAGPRRPGCGSQRFRALGDGRRLPGRGGAARRGADALARRARPRRQQERDRRDPRRRRRGGGQALGRRPGADAPEIRRAPWLQVGGDRGFAERVRRDQGGHLRDQGRRRLLDLQVRGRHASRPACARDRVPGPHPHLDGDGRRDARGRGHRHRDQRERPEDRRLPLLGPGRPVA